MDEELTVSGIQYQGSNADVLKVSLDDDSELFIDADNPAAQLAAGLRNSGDLMDAASLDTLRHADECYRCRRKAMDLLARSEQCRKGLEAKLSRKGWSRTAVATALDRMVASGFLDDRRFAESWIRSRLRSRPEGPSKLIGGLMSKGINGGTARDAVETVMEELGDETGDDALERAWKKLARKQGITEEKLMSALVRRGFPIGKVRAFLKERQSAEAGE